MRAASEGKVHAQFEEGNFHMPIYEYSCKKCEHQFEVLIRSKTDLPAKCPKCGTAKPVKQFSAFAVAATAHHDHSEACESCPSAGLGGCPGGSCGMDD